MADVDVSSDGQPSLNIGQAIGQQISASIQNMDIMAMLQKMVADTPEDEKSEEVRQKLQGIVDKYETMPDEEKEQFVSQMKNILTAKLNSKIQDMPIDMSGLQDALRGAIMFKLYSLAAVALVIFLIIVFFGYKLYKSITDKQKKQEEKKKLKEKKKKK